MHWLLKVLVVIAGNAFALWLANQFVPGFVLTANILQLALIGFILALLNWILKPILTLVLGPIIILTLGLGLIIVNAIILELLSFSASHIDFLSGSITIANIPALIFATLIISAVNFVIHFIA